MFKGGMIYYHSQNLSGHRIITQQWLTFTSIPRIQFLRKNGDSWLTSYMRHCLIWNCVSHSFQWTDEGTHVMYTHVRNTYTTT